MRRVRSAKHKNDNIVTEGKYKRHFHKRLSFKVIKNLFILKSESGRFQMFKKAAILECLIHSTMH